MKKQVKFKDINGYYSIEGAGYPLIFVHGYCFDGSVWDDVVSDLKKHYKIIRPDLPGFGDSSMTDEPLTVEWMAEYIQCILEQEQITNCLYFGHSLGGYVGIALVENIANNIDGFALIQSHVFCDNEDKVAARNKGIDFIQRLGSQSFVMELFKTMFDAGFLKSNLDQVLDFTEKAFEYSDKTLIEGYRSMIKRPDRDHVLASYSKPVLIVAGENDTSVTLERNLAQAKIPAIVDFRMLKSVGHVGIHETPLLMKTIIEDFVEYCSVRIPVSN